MPNFLLCTLHSVFEDDYIRKEKSEKKNILFINFINLLKSMVKFGHLWSNLGNFGQCCSFVVSFDGNGHF